MKVILFGATGMIGQGVLRECLLDPGIESVLAVGRSSTGQRNAKLREIVHENFVDFSAIESELAGFDACFFCLGVSSVGMSEDRYRHLTYDITLPRRGRFRSSTRAWFSFMSPDAAPTPPSVAR
jgi:nucleoside-diphosphate-sugar epimerase